MTLTAPMPGPNDTEFVDRAHTGDTRLGTGPKGSAAGIAHEAFDAVIAGKDRVVAGSVKNTVKAVAGHVVPDPALAAQHRKMSETGTDAD